MKHHSLIILSLLGALSAFAAPRDWTAADGRVINAEYLGRAPDGSALVLERTDTKVRVTVPVAALSASDQTFAATLPTKEVPPPPAPKVIGLSAKGGTLCAALPAFKTPPGQPVLSGGTTHADNVQAYERYTRSFAAIPSGDSAANVRTLRLQIARDLKDAKGAATASYNDLSTATKVRVYWLESIATPHLAKIEAEISK
ncbi:MAG: hypothetical protein H7067_02065 [Burkholderiales bacterium]|nr:hypothetical protein [Opitutaceae bacterium]